MQEENKQIAVNMIFQATVFIFSALVSFFVIPIVVKKISKEVYGFFGLATNIIEYAGIIALAVNGMANRHITMEYSSGNILKANKYFTSATVVNIFLAVCFCLPATLIVVFVDKIFNVPANHVIDVRILWGFSFAVYFINLIFSRYDSTFFVKNRLDISAKINCISAVIKTATLVVLYVFFKPFVFYLGVAAFLSVLYAAFMKVYRGKKIAPELRFNLRLYSFDAVKELMFLGIWSSLAQLSQMLFTGLDLLLANLFLSASAMSMLSIVKTFPTMLIGFIGIVVGAFVPSLIFTYAKTDIKKFIGEVKFSSKICGFICSVPVIGLIVFGHKFFSLWIPAFSELEIHKIQVLSILTLLPQTLSIYVFPLYQINTITCKVKIPAILDVGIGFINVLIVYLLLNYTNLGLYAIAGVSSLLLVIKILIFVPIYAADNLKAKPYIFYPILIRGVFNNVLLTACFMIINKISIHSWATFGLEILGAALVGYIVGMFTIFTKSEREKSFQLIKNKLRKE